MWTLKTEFYIKVMTMCHKPAAGGSALCALLTGGNEGVPVLRLERGPGVADRDFGRTLFGGDNGGRLDKNCA